jgi:EH_Signature domain
MNNVFFYTPKNLQKERILTEEKYYLLENEIIQSRVQVVLPRLLKLMQLVQSERIKYISSRLKKMDIKVLMQEYPFLKENQETRMKINEILIDCYQLWIGKRVWASFQENCFDPIISQLLNALLYHDKEEILNIPEEDVYPVLQHPKGIFYGIAEYVVSYTKGISEALSSLKIEQGSNLEVHLVMYLLQSNLNSDRIVNKEGAYEITRLLTMIPKENYLDLFSIYIQSRNSNHLQAEIMNQAINILSDPRVDVTNWLFLNEENLKKVKTWLFNNDLEIFFGEGNRRFKFWSNYNEFIEHTIKLVSPNVLFLYFKHFVVMEFGDGGAAYFYDKSGFEEKILPIIRSTKFLKNKNMSNKESMIKILNPYENGKALFLTKLSHTKNWEMNFSRYLEENFELY